MTLQYSFAIKITSEFVKIVEQEVVFICQTGSWLDFIEYKSTGHDGTSIQHRIVRLV